MTEVITIVMLGSMKTTTIAVLVACYEAFCVARQEINAGEAQSGFDTRVQGEPPYYGSIWAK